VSAELVEEPREPTERILRAAISCYTQYGVSRTTAGEVARVAGVSRGTIYRYFPGPRALETAAMNLMAHDVALQVDAAADPSQTFEQFVATLFEVLADHLVSIRARQHLLEERETIPWTMYQSNEDVTRRFIGRLLRDRLAAARSRDEIDPLITDADVVESVWIAVRAITSLQSSPVVDLDDPGDVGRWFARFVFRGLTHRPA
jgi:AcrR family transcriptional regulator